MRKQVDSALGAVDLPAVELVFNEDFAGRMSTLVELAAHDSKYHSNQAFRLLQVLTRSAKHGFQI
jgi:hypothetical protein